MENDVLPRRIFILGIHRTILPRRFFKTEILLKRPFCLSKRTRILPRRTKSVYFLLKRILNLGERTRILFSRMMILLHRIIILLWGRRIWISKFFLTETKFFPLNPKIKIWILICWPYSFPTEGVERSW